MKLNAIIPMMATENLDATVAFYRDTLGFRCLSQSPEWTCVKRDGVEIMLRDLCVSRSSRSAPACILLHTLSDPLHIMRRLPARHRRRWTNP